MRDIINLVESRLRSARIYIEKASFSEESPHTYLNVYENYPGLYVNINVVSTAFSIGVSFTQGVQSFGGYGRAATWETGTAGTHGGDGGGDKFLLSTLQGKIDKFINEYLKVNQKDCNR